MWKVDTRSQSSVQQDLTRLYQALPVSLQFNVQSFAVAFRCNSSSSFLLLHLLFHSVITLLHRPSLLKEFTPTLSLPFESSLELSRSVSLHISSDCMNLSNNVRFQSAQTIVHMLSLAEAFDSNAFIANPFGDLPILTVESMTIPLVSFLTRRQAARAFMSEREARKRNPDGSTDIYIQVSLLSCPSILEQRLTTGAQREF
jgi:hypothetical protein